MREAVFSGKAELVRDALREYVLVHEKVTRDISEGRTEDRKREEELFEWIRKARTVLAVQNISAMCICQASRGEIS